MKSFIDGGIPDDLVEAYKQLAIDENIDIYFRAVNDLSTSLIENGMATKGLSVHGKSAKESFAAGYIPIDPYLSKLFANPDISNPEDAIKKAQLDMKHSLESGHSSLDLIITQERLEELVEKDILTLDDDGYYKSTNSEFEDKFDFILAGNTDKSGVLIDGEYKVLYSPSGDESLLGNFKPVQVLGTKGENPKPLTADIDLFAISGHLSRFNMQNQLDTDIASGLSRQSSSSSDDSTGGTSDNWKLAISSVKKALGTLERRVSTEDEGFITNFEAEIRAKMNKIAHDLGMQDVVNHGTEQNNPFPENDEFITVITSDGEIQAVEREDLKDFVNARYEEGHYVYKNRKYSQDDNDFYIESKVEFQKEIQDQINLGKYGSTDELPFSRELTQNSLGDFLGEGVAKKVYAIKGYENKFAVTYIEYEASDDDDPIDYDDPEIKDAMEESLKKEIAKLDELSSEHGLRTVKHYGMVTIDGKPAFIMENVKNAVSIKLNDFTTGSLSDEVLSKFNTNTLEDIYKVFNMMNNDENFIIQDLQFLLKEDGHILINDPETVALEDLDPEQIIKLRKRMEDTTEVIIQAALESRSKQTNDDSVFNEHSPVATWDKDRYLIELEMAFKKVPETNMKNYDHQVHIVSFNPKDDVFPKNTAALVAKHKSNTTLLFMDEHGNIEHVYGKELSQINGKVRISIEGHGESQTLQGHTLEQIKNNIIKVDSLITQEHSTDKISFISCKIDTTTTPDDMSSRFGYKIITALNEAGLNTKVSVRTLSVSIDHDTGQKEVESGIIMYKKYYEGTYTYSIEDGEVKRENSHPNAPIIEEPIYQINNDGSIDVINKNDNKIVKSFKSVQDFNNGKEIEKPTEDDAPPPLPKKKGTYSSETNDDTINDFAKNYQISHEEAARILDQPIMKFLQEQGEIDLSYNPNSNNFKTNYNSDANQNQYTDRSNHKGYTSGSVKFIGIGTSLTDAMSSLQGFIEADLSSDTGKLLVAASSAGLAGSVVDTIDGVLANTKLGSSLGAAGLGAAGGLLAGAAGLVQVGMIGKDWDSYTDDQKIAAGIEMGLKVGGSLSIAASGIAMGVAAAKGITTGAAVVGPAVGAAAGAIALALSPLQILDFIEQGKRIDQLSDLGDVMSEFGYEGDTLLSELYGEKLAVEATLMAVQTSLAVAGSVVSIAAAASVVGAPVAVVVGLITGAISGILEATKQPMLEDIANRYKSKIDDAGGAEVYFKKNTDAQLKQMFANDKTVEAFKTMQEAYKVDGIISLNGVGVSDTAIELAAVTKVADEMKKANNYANLLRDGHVVPLTKKYLELNQVTGNLNINTASDDKLLIKFTTPLFAPGTESSSRTETGKNDYYTDLVIKGPDSYIIQDSDGSNILESNDKYATVLYDVDGKKLKTIHLNIYANGGDDSYKADGGKTIYDGGEGIDTVVYNGEHIHGITLQSDNNGKYSVKKSIVDADIVSEKLATREVSYGKRTETVTYRKLEVSKKSYEITDTLTNTEIIVGSEYNDTMIGNSKDDYFLGRNGNDYLNGGAGDDTLDGGEGNDSIIGDDGIDNIDGGSGDDVIFAGNHNDIILQSDRSGHDTIDAGEGTDTLDVSAMSSSRTLLDITFDNDFNSSNTDYRLVSNVGGDATAQIATQTKWDLGSKYGRNGSDDKFLFLDGASNSNTLFWKQNVELVAGHEYTFKFYMTLNKDVKVSLNLGGNDIASSITAENYSKWAQHTITFTAQTSGIQTIGLRDLKTVASYNDFAIDDIQLIDNSSKYGVTINLEDESLDKGFAQKDIIKNIENVNGTNFDDTIIGDSESNFIIGNAGNDYIDSKNGRDSISGGAGNDTILAGDNNDIILQADRLGNDTINGGDGIDTLDLSMMSSSEDIGVTVNLEKGIVNKGQESSTNVLTMIGTCRNDKLSIETTLADDFIWGSSIWVKFKDSYGDLAGVKISLNKNDDGSIIIKMLEGKYTSYNQNNLENFNFETGGTKWSDYGIKDFTFNEHTIKGYLAINKDVIIHNAIIDGGKDIITNIENVNGTNFDDIIIGDSESNFIIGNAGNDYIQGKNGKDAISGGAGNDTILAGNNNDIIFQSDINSHDIIDGGLGIDTLDLYSMILDDSNGVTINLEENSLDKGLEKLDKITNIENINGTKFNDIIIGDMEANFIVGNAGDDYIDSKDGRDYINGGSGDDTIFAGNHNDIILQSDRSGHDTIDAGEGTDTLDVSAMSSSRTLLDITFDNDFNSSNTDYRLVSNVGGDATAQIATQTKWDLGSKYGRNGSDDKFLFLDGASNSNTLFWKQNVELVAGHEYTFKFYMTLNKDVKVSLNLGGNDIASSITAENYSKWAQHTITFTAQTSGIQTIGLRDLKTVASYNDFAIDDIQLIDNSSKYGVTINLEDESLDKGSAQKDIIKNIENVNGTNFDDTIIGDSESNFIIGNAGNDYIDSKNGIDLVNGGAGNDTILAGDNNDIIMQTDRLGNDTINGGDGIDTLDLSMMSSSEDIGVTVNLEKGIVNKGQESSTNVLTMIGTCRNDKLSIETTLADDFIWGSSIWVKFKDSYGDLAGVKISLNKNDDGSIIIKMLEGKYTSYNQNNLENFNFETGGTKWSDYGIKDFTFNEHTIKGYLAINKDVIIQNAIIDGGKDIITNIENVNGTNFDDIIIGDDKDNILKGLKGDDDIKAANGNDTLIGGDGINRLMGEKGDDSYILNFDSINIIDDKEDINNIKIIFDSESIYAYNNYNVDTYRENNDMWIEIISKNSVLGVTVIKDYFNKAKDNSDYELIKIENNYLKINYSDINSIDETQYTSKTKINHTMDTYFVAKGEDVNIDLSNFKAPANEDNTYKVHILSGLDDDTFISSEYSDIYKFTGNNGIDNIYDYNISNSNKDKIDISTLLPDSANDDLSLYISIIGASTQGGDVSIKIKQDLLDESKDTTIILHNLGKTENQEKDLNGLLDYYAVEY